ncbi:MAG: hypothetical protein JWR84_1374 [Caulobacter sp.]|nr:hypothetical protein [Caulobacter sp.]
MTGFDVAVGAALNLADARYAVASMLGLDEGQIDAALDPADLRGGANRNAAVVVRSVEGGFRTVLSIDVKGGGAVDASGLSQRLACELGCECLIADDTANPYRWILVSPGLPDQVVFVDADALNEDPERWVIER